MSDHKATVIDGKAIAQTIRSEIATEVRRLSETYGKVCMCAFFICRNFCLIAVATCIYMCVNVEFVESNHVLNLKIMKDIRTTKRLS